MVQTLVHGDNVIPFLKRIQMKIHILTIGDEILIGQIIDTNSAWIGQQLNMHGGQIVGITSVRDDADEIKAGLQFALQGADAVLTTGGLGPTKDDITKKTLANFFGVGMVFSDATWERIQKLFEKWGRSTTPAHHEQCYMPANATLLHNKMGTAPGMWFEHQNKIIVSMPGVPYEMKYLMEHEVIPKLTTKYQTSPIGHRTILTAGEGETRIAVRIESFLEELPEHIKIAYLPGLGQVRLRLTGMGSDMTTLDQELDEQQARLVALIPELVYGYGVSNLSTELGQLLIKKGLTLATAESCTGGYLAHLITSISGSSAYFEGGIVAYSNTIKVNQLNVNPATLEQYGAVSEHTVREMVKGTLALLETDLAIAISGIAGPTGGTDEKPVGTIWFAVGDASRIVTYRLNLSKDRLRNIQYTSNFGLDLIRRFVLELI